MRTFGPFDVRTCQRCQFLLDTELNLQTKPVLIKVSHILNASQSLGKNLISEATSSTSGVLPPHVGVGVDGLASCSAVVS